MRATLRALGSTAGLAVWRLRFRYRGWNADADPVDDVRWAVRQLHDRHGDVPVVLVGHSMGGRAALRAADEPGVVGVVGLAPWVPPGEPHEQVMGRRLLVVHGIRDRMTSAQASKALVDAVRATGLARLVSDDATPDGAATDAPTFIYLRHGGHAMVRRAAVWDELTADFVLQAALGVKPGRASPRRSPRATRCCSGPFRFASLRESQDFRTGVGDQDRVFELRGAGAVLRHDSPTIVPDVVVDGAQREHGLDRERHAALDP